MLPELDTVETYYFFCWNQFKISKYVNTHHFPKAIEFFPILRQNVAIPMLNRQSIATGTRLVPAAHRYQPRLRHRTLTACLTWETLRFAIILETVRSPSETVRFDVGTLWFQIELNKRNSTFWPEIWWRRIRSAVYFSPSDSLTYNSNHAVSEIVRFGM